MSDKPKTQAPAEEPPKEKKFLNGWTREQEELMAQWSDIASCYRWMHDKCEKQLGGYNMGITIPVIILSTLTGSANFMMNSLLGDDKEMQKYAQIGIGGVSIFTGILTTLGNFFRFAQNSESNRVASTSWGKFQRQIAVELALHPNDRMDSMDFLKICRSELDRLIEQSPAIPDTVITLFENKFKDKTSLKRPDIANGMDHTHVFDDKGTRMKQMAVEAALMLSHKKRIIKDILSAEMEKRFEKRLMETTKDLEKRIRDEIEEQKVQNRTISATGIAPSAAYSSAQEFYSRSTRIAIDGPSATSATSTISTSAVSQTLNGIIPPKIIMNGGETTKSISSIQEQPEQQTQNQTQTQTVNDIIIELSDDNAKQTESNTQPPEIDVQPGEKK